MKRVVHLGSRCVRAADRRRPGCAVVPDLRRPALRHHVAVPGARRAPGGPQGGAAQGRALLRHVGYHRGHALVPGALPAAAQRRRRSPSGYGVPAQTFESSPYYMYHPHAAARIARDLPDVKLVVLVRDPVERAYSQHAHEVARGFEHGARLRQRARPGAGPAAPAGGAAAPRTRTTTASRTSTTRTGRAASTSRYLAPMAAAVGRDRIHVVDSERVLHRAGAGRTTRCWTSSACRPTSGVPAVRAAQRPARAPADMDPGSARELTEHYAPHDERAGGLARAQAVWRRA